MTMHPMPRTQEIERRTTRGYTMLAVGLALIGAGVFFIIGMGSAGPRAVFLAVPLILLGAFVLAGLYMLQPNEGAILLLFGEYKGTDRTEGLRWAIGGGQTDPNLAGSLNLPAIYQAQAGLIDDMDFVAKKLAEAFPAE